MRKLKKFYSPELRNEILRTYFEGDNSYEELGNYYGVNPATIRVWVRRYGNPKESLSLQLKPQTPVDMAHKKNEDPKSSEIAMLEARIRKLELENLALNTLLDVGERNGIELRKKFGAKQ